MQQNFFTNQIKTQKLFQQEQLQKQVKKFTSFFGKLMLMKAQLRIDSANVTSLRMRLWRSGKIGTVNVGVNSLSARTQNSKIARRSVN